MDHWLEEEHIQIHELEDASLDASASAYGQRYPLEGGILKGISEKVHESGFRSISVTGIEDCKTLFQTLTEGHIDGLFIEANICDDGCVGGPAVSKNMDNVLLRKLQIDDYLDQVPYEKSNVDLSSALLHNRSFSNKHVKKQQASETDILDILKSMGKVDKQDELNCGACGYNTCIEKAQAVYEGMSQPEMCIPYMRSKAEKLSHIIFENTPNIIFLLDENLNIVDANPACEKAFLMHASTSKGKALSTFIDDQAYRHVLETKQNSFNKKSYLQKLWSHYQ